MKHLLQINLTLLLILLFSSCNKDQKALIKINEVSPWCIIGFDSMDRSPELRISLLQELGLNRYGFNKGKGDLTTMIQEFNLASENDIEIASVFLWLNAQRDSIGKLSTANQELLNNIKKVDQKPAIWVSFSDNFFKEIDQDSSLHLSTEMIKYVKSIADDLGCKLSLYNHHGWFGNPHNQVKILEQLSDDSVSIVYNFHHAQEYVDEFPAIVQKIKPYLSFVNLNGVNREGPQIVTLGKGDHEYEMIKELTEAGFSGPWGILGHIKTEDVRDVLIRNLKGLEELNTRYKAEME